MSNTNTPIPEGKYLDMANGYRVHYHEAGPADGQPVIFLHGSGSGARERHRGVPPGEPARARPLARPRVDRAREHAREAHAVVRR